ncbi:MAG TPA: YidB family protein [Pseudorhodoplanes sp.]|jgi:uncharacterized protein YidB (DUF937 family)|nr:YidB family protein [Pseudorhodoplanes sp.]
MGLLDVLNGMQNGPRGQTAPGQGGMSPITMAILGLLAYKAIKHLSGQNQAPAGAAPQRLPDATTQASLPGGLGDALRGGLGGLLAGGAAGSVLSGGLNDLLRQFQDAGHGETADSWVGKGENRQISANDLGSVLGADQIETLMRHTGLSQNELLAGLSRELPGIVDQLTPHGRVPTADELSNWR